MALLDFLKTKEDKEKSKKVAKLAKVSVTKEIKSEEKNAEKPASAKASAGKAGSFSYSIIKEPHISEKASLLSAKVNQYTFKVINGFGKVEIKKAVEGVYNVNVLSVNIIKIPHKKRRIGKTQGFKKGFVKAVVTLKKGQTIEIL